MYKTILVPLDGSAIAERALPFAQMLARHGGGRLILVRAALAKPYAVDAERPDSAELIRWAREYLVEVANRVDPEVPTETAVLYGEAADVILSVCRAEQADLLVMSSHGESGISRWVAGTVADRVLRSAEVPVLLVPAGCVERWADERAFRVLVPLDGSNLAEAALQPATEFARVLNAELLLLQVTDPFLTAAGDQGTLIARAGELLNRQPEAEEYLDGVARAVLDEGIAVARQVRSGPVGLAIAAFAREQHADLIAMTPHGSGGASRLVLGRAATTVLQSAEVPVLLVRPRELRGEQPRPGDVSEESELNALPVNVLLTPRELTLIVDALENILTAPAGASHSRDEIGALIRRLKQAAPFEARWRHNAAWAC